MSKMSELWVCFPCCVTEQPQPVWRVGACLDQRLRSDILRSTLIPFFFYILQRRRRIDRSMIGLPTDFKVSQQTVFSRLKRIS